MTPANAFAAGTTTLAALPLLLLTSSAVPKIALCEELSWVCCISYYISV